MPDSVNLVYSSFKMVDLGLEYQRVERVLQAPYVIGSGIAATTGGLTNCIPFSAIARF